MKTINTILCDYCDDGHMVEEAYSDVLKHGRSTLEVRGLLHFRCETCDSTMTNAQQYEHNLELIRAAEKCTPGYVSPAMLREFREKYGLSQRTAGRLIGAGEGAFGKYESGSNLSAPTAKLIRAALTFPEVARMLAEEESITITVAAEEEWIPGKFIFHSVAGTTPVGKSVNDEFFVLGKKFTESSEWKKQNPIVEAA